jgi:hypothetical protein
MGSTGCGGGLSNFKDLKPETIKDCGSAAIVGLETSITDTLAAIFDHDSPKFRRYCAAADLEPATKSLLNTRDTI